MSGSKKYVLVENLQDYLDVTKNLIPAEVAEPVVVRPAVGGQLNDELGEFLEDASKSANRFDLRSGFFSQSQDITPRHVVNQEDLAHHRMGHFHPRHPLSLYAHGAHHGKKKPKKRKPNGARRSHKQKQETPHYQPSMGGLPETSSESSQSDDDDKDEQPNSSPTTGRKVVLPEPTLSEACLLDKDVSTDKKPPGEHRSSVDLVASSKEYSIGSPTGSLGVMHLHDVLMSDASTDPDMDPGVGSGRMQESQFGYSEDNLAVRKSSKVSFILGDTENEAERESDLGSPQDGHALSENGLKRKSSGQHHHHHHHHHHTRARASLDGRRALGSELCIKASHPQLPTEQEEASTLSGLDLDQMSNHRLGEAFGTRRRSHANHALTTQEQLQTNKLNVDHSPHALFVELAELHLTELNAYEWRDTARWIKYEEDVEAEVTRYGKPHVASLSFHSLLELRTVLGQGVVLLDLDGEDLSSIISSIVDQMVITDQLSPENKGAVIRTLLLRHRHVPERSFLNLNSGSFNLKALDGSYDELNRSGETPGAWSLSRTGSGFMNLGHRLGSSLRNDSNLRHERMPRVSNDSGESNRFSSTNVEKLDGQVRKTSIPGVDFQKVTMSSGDHVKLDLDETESSLSPHLEHHTDSHILRRIPKGAEATTVLVGAVDFLATPIMAFVRLKRGCFLGKFTEVPLPVRFLFILLGPNDHRMNYHEIGRSISTLMANTTFHDIAYRADERKDLLNAINEFLDESIVLPPGDYDKRTLLPIMEMAKEKARQRKAHEKALVKSALKEEDEGLGDTLQRTRRPFGGMMNDIRRRYPKYMSDIKDGLNLQCLAAFFFIYFACLSPAITFGGLLGEKTEQWMGVSELLVMTAFSGVLFSLLAAQPLLIVGFTGPIIVFEEGLYKFCMTTGIEYMPFRVWICLWVWLIAMLVVCFEGSFLVRYFTRFTMEIFASLISLIFIYEVFSKLYQVFQMHPLQSSLLKEIPELAFNLSYNATPTESLLALNETSMALLTDTSNETRPVVTGREPEGQPNTALLSLILTLGTFFIAYFLKQFRNSHFLGRNARRALGDFGIPIAIVVMVTIDYFIKETYTQKLSVPDGVSPTDTSKRGWFIHPLGMKQMLPVWAYFAAVLPGMLVFILIFMELQITGMIVSKKVKKGTGFHLDLFLIGCLSIVGGFLGLPLVTVATVRSVAHVSALSVFSTSHAPGEKPELIEVKEQRLTGLTVHIMIGVSVLMGPVLRQVPLAVLFGVFLYMGIASMSGIQLFERVEMLFIPRKHHPDVGYVQKVKTSKMHLYTLLQLVCLAVLWVVKSTKAALAFPFFLVLMVPLRRHLLVLIFTDMELMHLDNVEDTEQCESDEDEPDFYQQAHMPM